VGDAVNVASRMNPPTQWTDPVPDEVYLRLKDDFVLQERGRIAVKGKGIMRTWYLVAARRRPTSPAIRRRESHLETHSARV